MKERRKDRLIDNTRYLLERPHNFIKLTFFSKTYYIHQSTITHDLAIVRPTYAHLQTRLLVTVPGAAGRVR
ncbi:pur operon repressor, partial [Lacticaseibacillus paracasei]